MPIAFTVYPCSADCSFSYIPFTCIIMINFKIHVNSLKSNQTLWSPMEPSFRSIIIFLLQPKVLQRMEVKTKKSKFNGINNNNAMKFYTFGMNLIRFLPY